MTKAKEIMTSDLITINASASMAEAYKIMRVHNFRHLPVIDDRQKIVGILSDRDIQRSMEVKKINAFQQAVSINETRKVEDFMNWPVFTVSETTSIEKVIEEMLAQKVSAFVVSDLMGRNKGIVTSDDLLTFLLTLIRKDNDVKYRPVAEYFLKSAF